MDTVSSSQNPFIKYLVKLKKRKFREAEGKFLIEGARLVEEALKWNWQVECIIYSEDLSESDRGSDIVSGAERMKIKTLPVAGRLIRDLASTETPQGVMALCSQKTWRVEDISAQAGTDRNLLIMVADSLSDPGNLGAAIRSADVFGADGAVLTRGTVDLYNSKVLRATMGSVFHIPVVNDADPAGICHWLNDWGMSLLVGVPEGGTPVDRLDLSGPLALVVGSEARGPSKGLLNLPHIKATIPMSGRAESLNAAVATSIMLYEVARQRGWSSSV